MEEQGHWVNETGKEPRAGIARGWNPFDKTGAERDISMLIISTGFFLLYNVVMYYNELFQAFINALGNPVYIILLLPYLLIPAGIYLLHLRKKQGWILTCVFASYSLALFIPMLINFLPAPKTYFQVNQAIDPGTLLINLVFFGCLFYALNRKPVRLALGITPLVQYATILLAGMITFALHYYM